MKLRERWFKDEIDRKLVALLQADARQSTTTISKKLGVARSTIHERIARLERTGVITGYSAILSRNPSEESIQALIMLAVEQKKTKKIIESLRTYPEIKTCMSINGEFDLFLTIEAPRMEDIDVLIDEIATIAGIARTQTSLVFSQRFDRRYHETLQQITKQMDLS